MPIGKKKSHLLRILEVGMPWYKGNLHTHTTESDGDADPEFVRNWFKAHNYDFLVLSDHNHRTIIEHDDSDGLLMIPGEEITLRGPLNVHINGIGISRVVKPITLQNVTETIQANVDAIRQANGIASINHPNYKWAFDHNELIPIKGASLVEIYNAGPNANNDGGKGKYSTLEIWDALLSAGKPIFGVATDDSHHYYDFSPDKHNPGRAWVVVKTEELTQKAIIDGLMKGQFYSSTGIELLSVESNCESIKISVKQAGDTLYHTVFSGPRGVIYADYEGSQVEYLVNGYETYIRATVYSSNGLRAWVQPVFLANSI